MSCRCGCGNTNVGPGGWVHNHHLKGNSYAKAGKGTKKPPRTQEHRENLGKSLIGKSRNRMMGKGNPMFGKHPHNWNPDRKSQELKVKMRKTWHHLLGRVLRKFGTKKEAKTLDALGYSAEQLRTHIEALWQPGMSWENHGNGPGNWNIDHIKELKTFEYDADPKVVNALSNLRPLWREENQARNRKKTC